MAIPARPAPLLERVYASSWSTPVALALVVASVLFLVAFPRVANRRIERLRDEMTSVTTPAREAAGRIHGALALEVAAARGLLLTGDPRFRRRFQDAGADEVRAADELERLAGRLGEGVPERVAAFRERKAEWRQPAEALVAGRASRGEYLRDFAGEQARFEAVVAELHQVDEAIMAAENRRRAAVLDAEAFQDRFMVAAALVAFLSAVTAGGLTRRLRVLTRRARRRAQEEHELRHLARALSSAVTGHDVVRQVVDSAVANTRASGAYVEQISKQEAAVVAAAGTGTPPAGTRVPYPGSLTEAIIEDRDPGIAPDAGHLGAAMAPHVERACPGCTALVVPFFSETHVLGSLVLLRQPGSPRFEESDIAYARIVGDLASAALRRVTLLEQAQREQAALEASEEQFRAMAASANVAIFVIAEDDTIVFTNPPVEKIFGYTPSELIGRRMVTLIPPELRQTHRAGVARYSATRERRLSWEGVELPGLHKDGHEVPLEITIGEFVRDGRRYFTGIARDITERRRAEQERAGLLLREREARERVEAEIRTREEVLAIVSHDLRNPLNTIAMGAAALQDAAHDEAARAKYGQMIERAIHRMNRLIEDLLDVARLQGGQKLALSPAPVDLPGVITELCESFQAQARPKQQTLTCTCDPAVPVVTADRDRLAQVLSNLVGNALKFTPEGGRVEMRAAPGDDAAVRVSVRDTGPGIPPEHMERIFDPYWQAGRTAGLGAGLGLAIAKGIVESHGGRLWVDSRPGEGATFVFLLPVAGPAGAPAPDEAADRAGVSRR